MKRKAVKQKGKSEEGEGGGKAYGRKKRGEDWRGMGKKWDDVNVDVVAIEGGINRE